MARSNYDKLCRFTRLATGARAVFTVIIEGEEGHGISLECDTDDIPRVLTMLEEMMKTINEELREKYPLQSTRTANAKH